MGKRKSVVLMTLLTIVIIVLTAITALPGFALPGDSVKQWNPAINQYDLGADLGGGYYAYVYPKGVISETEYKNNVAVLEGDEKAEYIASYKPHNGGNLYLDVDAIDGGFAKEFAKATEEIVERFKAKNYSDYRISVVDNYALKIEIPASETANQNGDISVIGQTISMFTLMGDFTIKQGGVTVDALKDNEPNEVIKSISIGTQYDVAYLEVKFTDIGEEMIEAFRTSQETTGEEDSSSSTDNSKLEFFIGDQALMSVTMEHINDSNVIQYPVAMASNMRYVETMAITLNSVVEKGGYDIEFSPISTSDIRTYAPVHGDNTRNFLFIALGVAILVLIVFSIVKMGRFGWLNMYVTLSYFIITGLCFAFISDGIFELTLGSVFVFLMGLVLVNVLQMHVYYAIKKEFDLGKTVESSVKGGYKKTLLGIVDIYAVLLICGVSLLIGIAGMNTLASQIVLCTITGAFCNLLWGRAINYTFLSASKNKYKYFRFVREDDDDEE